MQLDVKQIAQAQAMVVFDLDGTLVDSSADLLAAANSCFVDLGFEAPLSFSRDQSTAFAGGRAMLSLGFKRLGVVDQVDALIEQEFPNLLAAYEVDIDRHTIIYPGAKKAVDQLRSRGYKTGICTNKPEYLAHILLDRLGIADQFGAVVGADTLRTRKPDSAPYFETVRRAGGDVAHSVLIGDTITDRKTATNAGVPCILVGFGPEGEGVSTLEPDALLMNFDRLEAVVETLIFG